MPADPPDRMHARTEQFWQAFRGESGLLDEAETARLLGGDPGEPARLRQAGELLAVERHGTFRYPAFQITDSRPRPLIAQLNALRQRHDLSESDVVLWMGSRTSFFGSEDRPVDHLTTTPTMFCGRRRPPGASSGNAASATRAVERGGWPRPPIRIRGRFPETVGNA